MTKFLPAKNCHIDKMTRMVEVTVIIINQVVFKFNLIIVLCAISEVKLSRLFLCSLELAC